MIEEVRISYRGKCEYSEAGYVLALTDQALPNLPRKGQVVTICGAGKCHSVEIKKRSVRREGKTLHVAFDVLEICNA